MSIEEIFSKISSHAAEGVSIHNQFSILFGFLNLCGYQKSQEYHYYEESYNYRCLQNFYLTHYGKMIKEEEVEKREIIPSNWYKYEKEEVDANNKKSTIKDIMKKWIQWEQDTKKLLESSYKQLYDLGDINGAAYVCKMVEEVSEELAAAKACHINLESIGYDMVYIIDIQKDVYEEYNEKIKKIYKDDKK